MSRKGFLDYFTEREDKFYAELTALAVLLGVILSFAVLLALQSRPLWQHEYLNWYFWPVFGAPLLVLFLAFVLPTWNRRRKTRLPGAGRRVSPAAAGRHRPS